MVCIVGAPIVGHNWHAFLTHCVSTRDYSDYEASFDDYGANCVSDQSADPDAQYSWTEVVGPTGR